MYIVHSVLFLGCGVRFLSLSFCVSALVKCPEIFFAYFFKLGFCFVLFSHFSVLSIVICPGIRYVICK